MDKRFPFLLEKDARKKYDKGKYDEALELFQMAKEGFEDKEKPDKAAEMANNICVVHLKTGNPQAGYEAVYGTDLIFLQEGDKKRQAMALANKASCLDGMGKLEEALEVYEEASRLLKAEGEDDMRASVQQAISALQLATGKQLQALASMKAGIEGLEKPSIKQKVVKKILDVPANLLNPDDSKSEEN